MSYTYITNKSGQVTVINDSKQDWKNHIDCDTADVVTIDSNDWSKSRGAFDFKWTVDKEISREVARELQINNGYHPGGYSFNSYKVENGKTTWTCYNNCD